MTDPLAARVVALIAAQARRPAETLAPDDRLEAMGLDSLNMVELVFAIEEAFDIEVPFNAQHDAPEADLSTVASVVAAVRSLVEARVA